MKKDNFARLAWTETERSLHSRHAIFDILQVHRTASDGREGDFVLVDSADWVTVIPFITRTRETVYMVRQFRHGSGSVTLEFPSGIVDAGELPEAAARRELLEETGCSAAELIHIGSVNPNPAFMNNKLHTFVALGLEKVRDLDLDDLELLELEEAALQDVLDGAGSGQFDNGILLNALLWLSRWMNILKERVIP